MQEITDRKGFASKKNDRKCILSGINCFPTLPTDGFLMLLTKRITNHLLLNGVNPDVASSI